MGRPELQQGNNRAKTKSLLNGVVSKVNERNQADPPDPIPRPIHKYNRNYRNLRKQVRIEETLSQLDLKIQNFFFFVNNTFHINKLYLLLPRVCFWTN